MRRVMIGLGACVLVGAGVFWGLTRPAPFPETFGTGLTADPQAGALVFAAAGCASCHAAPEASGTEKLILAGGMAFASDFGTFHAPNISPDRENGIGTWTLHQFARAVTAGVSPQGAHYYPAFPYVAYAHMTDQDVVDLHAYMDGLPEATTPSKPHEIAFPFNIRRVVGAWKRLYAKDAHVLTGDLSAQLLRGRYLVEGLAHCAECHTPRDALGGLDRDAWMAGAPNPSGKGKIPGIGPDTLDWSAADIAYYLETGFTPDFDSAGGSMVAVVENMAKLPASDRDAIAAYLKALPGGR